MVLLFGDTWVGWPLRMGCFAANELKKYNSLYFFGKESLGIHIIINICNLLLELEIDRVEK